MGGLGPLSSGFYASTKGSSGTARRTEAGKTGLRSLPVVKTASRGSELSLQGNQISGETQCSSSVGRRNGGR